MKCQSVQLVPVPSIDSKAVCTKKKSSMFTSQLYLPERRRRTNNNSHVVPNKAHSLEPLTDRESKSSMFTSQLYLPERRRRTNNNWHVVPNKAHSLEPLTDRESENMEFSRRRTYGRAVPFTEIGDFKIRWKNLSTAANLLTPAATANAGSDRFPRANLRAGSLPRDHPHPQPTPPRAGGPSDASPY
jgi:hypothetical protein